MTYCVLQEIKRLGGPGYKFIQVDEDEAANVLYCNDTLVHLDSQQIPKGFAVSLHNLLTNYTCASRFIKKYMFSVLNHSGGLQ